MNTKNRKNSSFGSLLRRGTAFVVSCAMGLSLLPAVALGAYTPAGAATIDKDSAGALTEINKPKADFRLNVVRTEYGTLTGTAELSLRVGPNTDAGAATVDFHSIMTALQFNTELLTPIDWEWTADTTAGGTTAGGTAATNPHEIDLNKDRNGNTFNEYYRVAIPAKKNDLLPATGAIAKCGIVDGTAAGGLGVSTNVANGTQALLFFTAEAYNHEPITLTEMTTLAVVRFKVNSDLLNALELRPDTAGSYSTGYTLYSDHSAETDSTVTSVATLNTVATSAVTLTGFDTVVGFASDADIAASEPDSGMALLYSSGSNQYYFVPGDTLGDTAAAIVSVQNPVDAAQQLDAPQTANDRILAVDDPANVTDYSYTSNLIPAANISFTVVSELSFADQGDGRENMATILFYDWDDTLIGSLIVPRNDDARALVNEYVRDNLIHPELQIGGPTSTAPVTTLVTSLARENTYRGKYPNTPSAAGTESTTTDGEKYPLTNKLDYVFLKRPMEQVTDAVTGDPTGEWKQTADAAGTAATWDEAYPYIYGWAFVGKERLESNGAAHKHPETVWTTIGVGELSDYTGLLNGSYATTAAATSTDPKVLTPEDGDFTFANFNFSETGNSLEKGSVFAVKAVYEPGESLQASAVYYSMSSEPYYNKLNYNSAEAGGAYSVDITISRANTTSDGKLCGIARIREPAVRQDTTADILWDSQYLQNATVSEANGKTKTTFTNVTVDNGEDIQIQLVLSARQNKVDWYLIDKYASNFVGGGNRTAGNGTFTDTAHVIDNYNYKTDTSDEPTDGISADYYDAPYEEREGSYGFVLFGTLNNLAQKLTEYDDGAGSLSISDFNNYLSTNNLNDVNIRSNTGEKPEFLTLSQFRNALKAAYNAAKADYAANPTAPKAWDTVHDCAQFTYHQLQHYVIDYMASGSATLMTAAAADGTPIKWCHLHDSCAAASSGKPRNWNELITLAGSGASDAKDKISLLTLAELKEMTFLRKDARGTEFGDVGELADAVIAAVTAGCTSWDTIQDYIIRGSQPDAVTYSQENYWWYDGESVSFSDLSNTLAAVQDSITAVTMPDGTTGTRNAKINQLQAIFDADSLSATATTPWINATKNLAKDADGHKFDNWTAFRTALIAAEAAMRANGEPELTYSAADDVAAKRRTYWNKLQYHILNGTYTSTSPDFDTYWWYDGAVQVKDLATLIKAAQDMNSGKPASWNGFTFDKMYDTADPNAELWFVRDFKGTRYTNDAADPSAPNTCFDDMKALICDYVRDDREFLKNNPPDWDRLQYYLIHGHVDAGYIRAESAYYWWKDGDHQVKPVDFTTWQSESDPATRADQLAKALMEAAFRATYNGNTVAWDELDADPADILELGRLAKASGSAYGSSGGDFTLFDSTNYGDVKNAAVALMGLASTSATPSYAPTVSWHQVQHYILTNIFEDTTIIQRDFNYWWKGKDSNGVSPTQLWSDLTDLLKKVADGDSSAVSELQGWYDAEKIEKLEFTFDGNELVDQDTWESIPWDDSSYFDWSLCDDGSGNFVVTWAQIECIFAYYYAAGDWYFTDDDESRTILEDDIGGIPTEPSWASGASLFAVSLTNEGQATVNVGNSIRSLTARVKLLANRIAANPSLAEDYLTELNDLLAQIEELKALLTAAAASSGEATYTVTPDTTPILPPAANESAADRTEPEAEGEAKGDNDETQTDDATYAVTPDTAPTLSGVTGEESAAGEEADEENDAVYAVAPDTAITTQRTSSARGASRRPVLSGPWLCVTGSGNEETTNVTPTGAMDSDEVVTVAETPPPVVGEPMTTDVTNRTSPQRRGSPTIETKRGIPMKQAISQSNIFTRLWDILFSRVTEGRRVIPQTMVDLQERSVMAV